MADPVRSSEIAISDARAPAPPQICNHPDLLERARTENAEDYGNPERGGKLQVLRKLLAHWRSGGHKALLFTQTQQMLDILEKLVRAEGYTYHR